MQTYNNERGRYQKLYQRLQQKLECKRADLPEEQKWSNDWWLSHPYWAIFNGMVGIYYERNNSGSGPKGAIDNNRVHGYSEHSRFVELLQDYHAPTPVIRYVLHNRKGTIELEEILDQTILFIATKKLLRPEDEQRPKKRARRSSNSTSPQSIAESLL